MKKDKIISICGKQGPFDNVLNALSALDLGWIKNKTVLIKPNVGRSAKPERGYNAHPEAVAAVIETLQKAGVKKIAIGESPLVGIKVMDAFEKSGIKTIADEYGIELLDFDARKPIKKIIKNARVVSETKICADVFDYDVLVSVPVAKTHMHTGVTLGIKNLKGCLYRHEKVRYHQLEYNGKEYPEKTLDSAISDLATILLPDLTIIDGYIGMEGLGPSGGHPIKSDFAVASRNPLGADVFGCVLMGQRPDAIPHLKIISERLKLPIHPSDYQVIQDDFERFIYPYQKPPKEITLEYKNVKVHDNESCSACLSTLMLFLRRFNEDMSQYLLDDGFFHIAIGKNCDNAPKGTVFIGNCTRNNKEKGIFVSGCPPVPTRIYKAITGNEPDVNEPEVD